MSLNQFIMMLRGEHPTWPTTTVDALERDWTYRPSRIGYHTRALRIRARMRRRPGPATQVLRAVTPRQRWTCYFLYLPDGVLQPAHRFTLERLRARNAGLLVVCATPDPAMVPAFLHEVADALIWKDLGGFDFCAYALAIETVARNSAGADLFIMNDSVLGPFTDLDAQLDRTPWDLTGFTAFARIENHIQSYAFNLRSVTPATVAALRPALSSGIAHDYYRDVIYAQETRLARVAARSMSVGSLWYAPDASGDASIFAAMSLVANDFPFLKRKLLGREKGHFAEDLIHAYLEERRHPLT